MSAGVASLVPPRELPLEALLNACTAALKRAKEPGQEQHLDGRGDGFSLGAESLACGGIGLGDHFCAAFILAAAKSVVAARAQARSLRWRGTV